MRPRYAGRRLGRDHGCRYVSRHTNLRHRTGSLAVRLGLPVGPQRDIEVKVRFGRARLRQRTVTGSIQVRALASG